MPSWRGIEEVVAAHAAGSFAAGAKALGISTSQMSREIAALEDRLRTPIFFRTTRRIALTDAGRALIEHFERLVQERDEALVMVAGGEAQGALRITCSTALGERFVAPIILRFAAEHPRVSINLDFTNRLVDLVGEGYDLALRTGAMSDSQLIATRIASRRLYLCAAPRYLERLGTPSTVDDLRRHECLIGSTSTWHFRICGKDEVFRPKGRWRCNSGSVIVDAAVAGMGICQLPEFYVLPHIAAGRVVPLLEAFRPSEEPVWAVYPQRRHFLPKLRLLVEQLRAELGPAISGRDGAG